jgi:hypothetical protein
MRLAIWGVLNGVISMAGAGVNAGRKRAAPPRESDADTPRKPQTFEVDPNIWIEYGVVLPSNEPTGTRG